MKLITFYLPQFHTFPENDEFWGKGFTEWTNVKKARPLYKGHYEPRVPLDDNYYDLTNPKTFEWQVDLAKKYGVYGFCFYHYWFSGKILMQKPMEMFLQNKNLSLHYCISWANETWSRRWNGKEEDILIKQEYGTEREWIEHFNYLLTFFKDDRYIKIDGYPLFILYKPEIFPDYQKMFALWNRMAQDNGFPGIKFAIQSAIWNNDKNYDHSKVDYRIMFEPGYTDRRNKHSLSFNVTKNLIKVFRLWHRLLYLHPLSYREYCKDILNRNVYDDKFIPGMFVNWDNTPRRKERGATTFGNTPEIFQKTLSKLIKKAKNEYHKDMIFINAWNEWAEGCYLEPDKKYGYAYLQAVRQALIDNNESIRA